MLSFQIRGALSAVRSLVEESKRAGGGLPRAVVTHSSGNHGQALACAAQAEGNAYTDLQPQLREQTGSRQRARGKRGAGKCSSKHPALTPLEISSSIPLLNACGSYRRQGMAGSCSANWLLAAFWLSDLLPLSSHRDSRLYRGAPDSPTL